MFSFSFSNLRIHCGIFLGKGGSCEWRSVGVVAKYNSKRMNFLGFGFLAGFGIIYEPISKEKKQ